MILGQPWLFSHSTKIDYIHNLGMTLQFWENGDRKGHSILIHLPLVKAPWNVMPVNLCCNHEVCCASARTKRTFAFLGDDPKSLDS